MTTATTSLRERLAALQARAATAVAAADEQAEADRQAKADQRVAKAVEKRFEAHVHGHIKRLDPSDREKLLAEFEGDEEAAEKAAAEILRGMTPERQRYLKFAGWDIYVGLRLKRLLELMALRSDAEGILKSFEALPAGAEKDGFVAEATKELLVIDTEKTEIEKDPMLRFFAWEATIVVMENPGEREIVAEIEVGLKGNYLRELSTEEAEAIREAGKKAKAEGREERNTPFIRIKRRPAPNPSDRESLENFRCVSYSEDADRERESRNRLIFYALNGAWSDYLTERKEDRRAFAEFREKCTTFSELAAAKPWVGIGENITKEDPWIPMRKDPDTKKKVPMIHQKTGEVIKNWGPVILVVRETKGGKVLYFPVLNREVEIPILDQDRKPVFPKVYVSSGMYMPLLKAGAWEEGPDGVLQPVEFRFNVNEAFGGLRPASREVWLEPWKLGVLRAIVLKAGNLEAPPREDDREEAERPTDPPANPAQLQVKPRTRRGERPDGTKAGEPRRGKGRNGSRPDGDEVPDLSRIGTLAEGQQAVGEGE